MLVFYFQHFIYDSVPVYSCVIGQFVL